MRNSLTEIRIGFKNTLICLTKKINGKVYYNLMIFKLSSIFRNFFNDNVAQTVALQCFLKQFHHFGWVVQKLVNFNSGLGKNSVWLA